MIFFLSENSFWVNIDWLQGYAAFSFGTVFCIFKNVSWEAALASTETKCDSLLNPEWSLGAGLARLWAVGL